MPDTTDESHPQWNPHAAVAGWLVPGLGHVILGQKRRGIILGITIGALWIVGLLIGGVGVIDKHDRGEPPEENQKLRSRSWWYFGQAMIAPSIVVEYSRTGMALAHSKKLGFENDPNPRGRLVPEGVDGADAPPYEPSIGHVAEQGTLYTALAGMLNLLAIIDVLYCDPRTRRQESAATIRPANIAEAV